MAQRMTPGRGGGGGMFESSITFLRVRGIPIGAHWSWLFVFALVTWALGSQLFPATYPGIDGTTAWVMAVVAALLFFTSVLLHELGHALTGAHKGLQIEGITLWLFGGVAKIRAMFPSPGGEFHIAAMGPAVSLGLAVAFGLLNLLGGRLAWPDPVVGVVDYLARINLIVLGFNLVPALPLDGGRILRAYLWKRQGSFESATYTAARAGMLFGFALVGLGIFGFFTDAGVGGLWIALIGWFLIQAAQSEAAHATLRHAFRDLRVADVMRRDPDTATPDEPLDALVLRASQPGGRSVYPVVESERVVGVVTLRQVATVPVDRRPSMTVRDVMTEPDTLPVLRSEQDVNEAVETMQDHGRALVLEDDRLVGFVSMSDVARAVRLRRELGEERPPATQGAGFAVWAVVALAILLALGWIYHPPVAELAPGPAIDVADGIEISGADTTPINGEYLLVTVTVRRPNGLQALYALAHPDRDLLPLDHLIPEGVREERFDEQQRALFRESRQLAAVAAARALGLPVDLQGTGARVVQVLPGSPAADVLRTGDVIVAIEGRPITSAADAAQEIRSFPPRTTFEATVERGGSRRDVTLRTERLGDEAGGIIGIGVSLRTEDFDADLPFEVTFPDRAAVGGPSGGLTYALAIADLLDERDLAAGRTIAATGTIGFEGRVGPVGGVSLKANSVAAAGAELFLVPLSEIEQARGEGVPIRGVDTLEQALRALAATA